MQDLLSKIWCAVPFALKNRLRKPIALAQRFRVAPFVLHKARPLRTFAGRHVAVVGWFGGKTGLARAAELLALGLLAEGCEVTRVALPFSKISQSNAVSSEACQTLDPSDVLFVVNPPHYFSALSLFDKGWLQERCIVAHWVWELNSLPAEWLRATETCDEIWAPSPFVVETIAASANFWGRFRLKPYPAHLDPFERASDDIRVETRGRFGIRDQFVFGYSFSSASNFPRKNPKDAILAFKLAFPERTEPVSLLIRANDVDAFPAGWRELERLAQTDTRIILKANPTPINIRDFYSAIDAYVSPSRCEGFGLNLVEASQVGLPVITTPWGLSPEILDKPNVHAAKFSLVDVDDPQGNYWGVRVAYWAQPDIADFAIKMREVSGHQMKPLVDCV